MATYDDDDEPSRRDGCFGDAAAEKLTGIESQNKVIIQIHEECSAPETGRRRRLRCCMEELAAELQ